jgi:hypothetical protein|tara:strand:+ start:89 stop:409 length:321 start_codon:yes stop_codon:yes gene_type:complete
MTGLLLGVWIIVIFLAVCVFLLFRLVKDIGDLNDQIGNGIKVYDIEPKKELSNISEKINDISSDTKELTKIALSTKFTVEEVQAIRIGFYDIKQNLSDIKRKLYEI